jgi:pectate lyase
MLRSCLGRGGADAIADVALTVDPGARRLTVAPNTTLDGQGLLTIAPSLRGIDITVFNVIVRNTVFHGPGIGRALNPAVLHMVVPTTHSNCTSPTGTNEIFGCAVQIQIRGGAQDIWIDHNTFSSCGDICISVLGENDGAARPDMVTVSNNIFRDSFFAANFGLSAMIVILPPPGHATLYGNLFDHVFRRQPGAGGYQLHVFNNYWRDYGGATYPGARVVGCNKGFGPEVTGQAEMLLEANVAEAGPCREAVDNQFFRPVVGLARGYGKVRAVGNLGLKGATVTGSDTLDFTPTYPYRPLPVNQVKEAVLAHAGAQRR